MKKTIIILFSLVFLSCKGQTINNSSTQKHPANSLKITSTIMDTIYKQQFNQIVLNLVRVSNDPKITWEAILINKKGQKVILHSESVEKNMGWKSHEEVGESPIDLYNISGSYLDGNNLYMIYNRFGSVVLVKYHFTEGKNFEKEEKLIDYYLVSGGFGKMINEAQFGKISNELYFNLLVGQDGKGIRQNLYKINLISFDVKKIKFDENPKPVKVIRISNFGKIRYEETEITISNYNKLSPEEKEKNKFIAPTDEQIREFNTLKEYLNDSFYYKEMSIDKRTYEEEKQYLEDIYIEDYPLFAAQENDNDFSGIDFANMEKAEFLPIDKNKIKKAENYLKEVLAISIKKGKINKIKLIDYIYQSKEEYNIFFFYKEDQETKIIRYNNYKNEWLIGRYVEEGIKIE